jgi:hypothetical protein
MLVELLLSTLPFAIPQEGDDPVGKATIYHLDTIETLEGEALKNASILVRDGIIERLGASLIVPDNTKVVDLRGTGATAMPPLVLSHAGFFHSESRGRGRYGKYRAVDAVHPDADSLQELREMGVLLVGVDPPGAGIAGRTSILRSDMEDFQADAVVRDLHLKLSIDISKTSKDVLRKALDDADKAIAKEKKAFADWEKARADWKKKQEEKKKAEEDAKKNGGGEKPAASAEGNGNGNGNGNGQQGNGKQEEKAPPETFTAPQMDPNLTPIVEWIRQERVAQIWLDAPGEWLHWKDVIGERELAWEVVLSHSTSTNFHEIAKDLADSGVRVFAPSRISFLPSTRLRNNLPLLLSKAGVKNLVLTPMRSNSLQSVKDWRVGLSDLVREGLDRSTALSAISIEPAKSMGQEEKVAPLTAGGTASFVIMDGDPLDPFSEVVYLVAEGDVLYDRAKDKED